MARHAHEDVTDRLDVDWMNRTLFVIGRQARGGRTNCVAVPRGDCSTSFQVAQRLGRCSWTLSFCMMRAHFAKQGIGQGPRTVALRASQSFCVQRADRTRSLSMVVGRSDAPRAISQTCLLTERPLNVHARCFSGEHETFGGHPRSNRRKE